MVSQTGMRFEKLNASTSVFSVNISNYLFDQTALSGRSKLFLYVDVVTQVWGEDVYVGHNFIYSKEKFKILKLTGWENLCLRQQFFPRRLPNSLRVMNMCIAQSQVC